MITAIHCEQCRKAASTWLRAAMGLSRGFEECDHAARPLRHHCLMVRLQ